MKFRRIFIGSVLCAGFLAAGYVFTTVKDLGEFRELHPHQPADCHPVLGVHSSEDITIDLETGIAYISSNDRRARMRDRLPGAVYSYSLVDLQDRPRKLTGELEFEFHPHGMSLYESSEGKKVLFVVNHRTEADYVEIFSIRGSNLVHEESVSGEAMFSANDVVAVSERNFYVTNDHGYRSSMGRSLEEYLRLREAYVLFFDGSGFRVAAEGLAYANGVNISPDGRRLYVAATLEGAVHVYSRNPADHTLNYEQSVFLGTGVDNIEIDAEGNLWIGAHPKLLTFLEYSRNPGTLSPSQVLRVRFAEDETPLVEEVYLGDGEYLSGSSVGAVWKDHLLIGSVFDQRFLRCELDSP